MVQDHGPPFDADAGKAAGSLSILGFSHRSCPASLRERLFMEDDEAQPIEAALRDSGAEAVMMLSTCDRVDLVYMPVLADDLLEDRVVEILGAAAGLERELLRSHQTKFKGTAAFRYLARVAAGMESQIVGEAQVLGQLKAAHRRAEAAGHLSGRLSGVLQAAYRAAKRVRTETAIGAESVSLASAAVDLVQQLHGPLKGLSAVLVGSGDMGPFLVDALRKAGLVRWTAVGRTERRSMALARQIETAQAAVLDGLGETLDRGDVVVTALGEGTTFLTADRVEAVLRRRRRRPMFFLDVGVPGDVDPAVHRLDDAFVYTLDDLSNLAEEGLQKRRATLDEAERIIVEETLRFETSQVERSAVPTIQALTRRLERMKKEAAGPHADEATLAALDRFAARILHHPATALRQAAAREDGPVLDASARTLFRLDGDENEDGKDDG